MVTDHNDPVFSIHEYELKPAISETEFIEAVTEAEARGCFDIHGLVEYRIGKGIRGTRTDGFAAVWVWKDLATWEAVWGSIDDPVQKEAYPDPWLVWEDEILEPLLDEDPDEISFTAYRSMVS